jgi:hypothetical protein
MSFLSRFGCLVAIGLGFGLLPLPHAATAQTITSQSLQGSIVDATVHYNLKGVVRGRQFDTTGHIDLHLRIGAGGTITGSVTRTVQGFRQVLTKTRSMSATIGRPKQLKTGDHGVIVLSGNTLTLLRTFEVGGSRTTVTFGGGGRTCTIRAPLLREVGAGGNVRRDHVAGGSVDITSSRQTSSSCRVSR